jgi:hypothetical protein
MRRPVTFELEEGQLDRLVTVFGVLRPISIVAVLQEPRKDRYCVVMDLTLSEEVWAQLCL